MEASKAAPAPRTPAKEPTLTTADGMQDLAAPHLGQHGAQGEQRHSHKGDAPQGCRGGRDRGTERVGERHGRLGAIPARAGAAGPRRTCRRAWDGLPSPGGKPSGEMGRTVQGQDPAGLSPTGSHPLGTGIGLIRQSCRLALARNKEARQLRSPPVQHRAFREGEDPFSLLSQISTQGPGCHTISAGHFAQGEEHNLIRDLPHGLQVALELGHDKVEVGAGQSYQDVTSGHLHVTCHTLQKRHRLNTPEKKAEALGQAE